MGNTGIHWDPEAIRSLAKKIEALTGDFSTKVTTLKNAKADLAGNWSGEAAQTYEENFDEQAKSLDQFGDIFNEMSENLAKGADNFEATEDENRTESAKIGEMEYDLNRFQGAGNH